MKPAYATVHGQMHSVGERFACVTVVIVDLFLFYYLDVYNI